MVNVLILKIIFEVHIEKVKSAVRCTSYYEAAWFYVPMDLS